MLARLIELQQAQGLTDAQMAERLGISRARWQQYRTGRDNRGPVTEVTGDVAIAAAKAWPDLAPLLLTP